MAVCPGIVPTGLAIVVVDYDDDDDDDDINEFYLFI